MFICAELGNVYRIDSASTNPQATILFDSAGYVSSIDIGETENTILVERLLAKQTRRSNRSLRKLHLLSIIHEASELSESEIARLSLADIKLKKPQRSIIQARCRDLPLEATTLL